MSALSFDGVYNEVTHRNSGMGSANGLDPMYHWDTHYPERISQLTISTEYASPIVRRSRKDRRTRNSARFKTQPITFDEIQEVDEENPDDKSKCSNMTGLKTQFTAFSRSMDGLMPTLGSNKHRPCAPLKPLAVPQDINENDRLQHQSPLDGASGDSASDDAKSEMIDLSTQRSVPVPLLTDSARNRRQKRFKKKQRHSRSIEEVPEIDKTCEDQAVR